MNIIEVKNLVFDYPNKRALNNLSFEIETNTIVALVGPNGAGKTTLLRCLAGLDTPLTGQIEVGGINAIEHPRQCRQRIGYLSDFFGLYDELTVLQHLQYISNTHNLAADTARLTNILSAVNLTSHAQKKARELSRGLRQRLGIAMSIIHQPEILLLDEPASGLDPEARHTLSQLFLSLHASGMTIICSSHILAELEEYSTHMLIVDDGHFIDLCAVNRGKNMQHMYLEKIQTHRGTTP